MRGRLVAALLLGVLGLAGMAAARGADGPSPDTEVPARELGVDAELGFVLSAPRGWIFERATGAGERLRLVRRDGRAWCSLVLRALAPATVESATALARVRASLSPELPGDAVLADAPEGRVEVEHVRRAELVRRLVHVRATAVPEGECLVLAIASWLEDAIDAPALAAEADEARRSLRRCPAELTLGRARLVRDEALRVALVDGLEDEVRHGGGALTLEGQDGVRVEVGPAREAPLAALAAALETDERSIARVASAVEPTAVRGKTDKARGAAWTAGAGTVLALVRGGDVVGRKRASGLLVVADATHGALEAARASEAAAYLGEARDARAGLRHADAVAAVASVLALFPEDPDALELRAALRRDQGDRGVPEVEAAWLASGYPWATEVLAKLRLEDALAHEGARRTAPAAFRFAHALELAPTPDAVARAERFFSGHDALNSPWQVLPGLARARELLPESTPLREAEASARLRVAELLLEEGKYARVREELRKARAAGAEIGRIEAIDDRTRAAEKAKVKRPPAKKPLEPVEDEERPRRRERREPWPVAGWRPLAGV